MRCEDNIVGVFSAVFYKAPIPFLLAWCRYKLSLSYHCLVNQCIRELVTDVKFIDQTKVCVWGWSYGGYVTGMVMTKASDLISCGIAVSPVTQWQHYDTAYTERFMGLPGHMDNWQGYMR